jgi:putative hemolysin
MSTIAIELLLILILTIMNGILALSEIAVLSSRKARLQDLADGGLEGARGALRLADSPGVFLSTVQVGITLVGVLAGAFGGATIAEQLASVFERWSFSPDFAEAAGLAVVVLGITYGSLVFGELVPKRIALSNPELIASKVARSMSLLARLSRPVVRLLSASTNAVMWALRIPPASDTPVSEEELKILFRQGAAAGVFEKREQEMLESVLRLGDRTAIGLMTPRTAVVALFLNDPPEVTSRTIATTVFSRFPVCHGTLDNVIGFVQTRDLLSQTLSGRPFDLRAAVQEPLAIPESMTALKILDLFRRTGKHFAIVLDEYGGLHGLVTLNNILGVVVGEVAEGSRPRAEQRDDGSWLVDGLMPIDEFKSLLHLRTLPGEEKIDTLGGYIITSLSRIPSAGDRFEAGGMRYEVVDMDGLRVDKVLVTPPRRPPAA